MVREVNLGGYLPGFVAAYREVKNSNNAMEPELQALCGETEVIRENQYIITCDSKGIARFERLVGITPDNGIDLAVRKQRVLIRWNDTFPYTFRGLLQKLEDLCGPGNYEVLADFSHYEMEVVTYLETQEQIGELVYLLGYMTPANILWRRRNIQAYETAPVMVRATGAITAYSVTKLPELQWEMAFGATIRIGFRGDMITQTILPAL